jgi:VanZ family protein
MLWAAVIFTMSSVPGSQVPGRFGSLAHFVEYAILALLLARALSLSHPQASTVIGAVVLSSAYAVTDELHQSFVPMRVPDPMDWLLDTAGAIVSVLLWLLVANLANRRAQVASTPRSGLPTENPPPDDAP